MSKEKENRKTATPGEERTMKPMALFVAILCFLSLFVLSCATSDAQETPKGRLFLVSVGNGDPDNITLRALSTIKKSDVIFCMDGIREAFPDILRGKEIHKPALEVHRTFMRKEGEFVSAMREVERVDRIVRKAILEGRTVSVLDSGDPTVYGPNMWFMEIFEDLNPEIVPGVSSFNAANAALKKGVTSGETTRSVVLTNGFDVEKLAGSKTTMVFFTMHLDVPGIVKRLRAYYPPETPVAIVANAGYKEKEKIIQGTLNTIEEMSKGEKLSMYLVYVGDFLTRRYGIALRGYEGNTKQGRTIDGKARDSIQ